MSIAEIEKFCREKLDDLNYYHTLDVRRIALKLAEKEGADRTVVELAALLHDIGKSNPKAGVFDHHKFSIKIAEEFLEEQGYDKETINKVSHVIETHMGPKLKDFPKPETSEDKVVYDADMINLCSPFGVAKIIHVRTGKGLNFKKAVEEAKKLAYDAFDDLKTDSGKKYAKPYFDITKKFFENIRLGG